MDIDINKKLTYSDQILPDGTSLGTLIAAGSNQIIGVYFDHVDMVDQDSGQTILENALGGDYTIIDLLNASIKFKARTLVDNAVDNVVDHTVYDRLSNQELTVDELKSMPAGSVFAMGVTENSPEGIYMTTSDEGRALFWVAKRGDYHDWAIYIYWNDTLPPIDWMRIGFNPGELTELPSEIYEKLKVHFVCQGGQKVTSPDNIIKLVPCDKAALNMYRL